MNVGKSRLDAAFLEKQRQYLLRLRSNLRTAARASEADAANIETATADSAREFEDEAQKLDALELSGGLVARDAERLKRVDRALASIENGTYGFSDVSGQPIPRERLEVVPEAVCTLKEEQELRAKALSAEGVALTRPSLFSWVLSNRPFNASNGIAALIHLAEALVVYPLRLPGHPTASGTFLRPEPNPPGLRQWDGTGS